MRGAIIGLSLALAVSGCGNGKTFSTRGRITRGATSGGTTSVYYNNPALSQCSAQNVLPDYDRHLNGSGYYTACWMGGNQLRLRGRAHYGNYVCVIPSLVSPGSLNSTAAFWYFQGSEEIYRVCGQLVNEELVVNFGAMGTTPPNAVFVIESPFITQATQVLTAVPRNFALMPEYSYGFPGNGVLGGNSAQP